MHPKHNQLNFKKKFYVTFFEDHYFVDGILNKNFAYGTYPTTEERKAIVRQFKDDLLDTLKEL